MTQQHASNAHVYAVLQAVNTIANFPLPYSIGYRCLSKLGALTLYTLFLLPGFIRVGYYYYFDKRVHRSITYGPKPRNRLDLYLPENLDSPKPVVLFITGGAWLIGYKAWGSLLGMQLLEKDIIVACIDYRNFPQGSASDMIEDIAQGISFIAENAENFGGDRNRLYLVGQSAGAHLAACTLVEQAIKENKINQGMLTIDTLKWKASQFKAFFGISGVYNLKKHVDHFHECGLYRSLFFSIMEGEGSLQRFSPEIQVQSLSSKARSLLPPVILFHGTSDKSIPASASTSFSDVLKSFGAEATTRLYKDKTHTDVFLQDPLRGGHDILLVDMLSAIRAADKETDKNDVFKVCRPRLVPEILLNLAHKISPF